MLRWKRTKRLYDMHTRIRWKTRWEQRKQKMMGLLYLPEAHGTSCDRNKKSSCDNYGRGALKNTINITAVRSRPDLWSKSPHHRISKSSARSYDTHSNRRQTIPAGSTTLHRTRQDLTAVEKPTGDPRYVR